MSESQLGAFEELVLLAVCILADEAYGNTVLDELKDQTGRSVSLGAVHATLYRLQDKGFLSSSMGGATQKRGGRRKRLFSVTSAGFDAVRSVQGVRNRMWSMMPDLRTRQATFGPAS